jgi:uncharacterized protein (TIGR03437 family)
MGNLSTVQCRPVTVLSILVAVCAISGQIGSAQSFPQTSSGQTPSAQLPFSWSHAGNEVVSQGLAGLATGPVSRVWFGNAGAAIFAQTVPPAGTSGRVFTTTDLENWQLTTVAAPALPASIPVPNLPESGAQTRAGTNGRVYAFGSAVYRSDDGGVNWENVSTYRGASIIGGGLNDLAVSPENADEVIVAGEAGVFRSTDGGSSWSGLNDGLPNLPVRRLWDLPVSDQGLRVEVLHDAAIDWPPGDKVAWQPTDNSDIALEAQLRVALSAATGTTVTAVAIAGNFVYAGMQNGVVQVSSDGGLTWQTYAADDAGAVERFWVSPQDPRVALAVLGAAPADPFRIVAPTHVLHTVNGGGFWDDFTANLPDTAAHGVTSDPASGAIYVATDAGVFLAYTDLSALGSVQSWLPVPGLPAGAVMDVKLDAQANQLWAAVDGYGVYSILAPHRTSDPNVVSAADLVARAVAPGSLVSILGARVDAVRANDATAPVLAATAAQSQVQIPFEARGNTVAIAASAAGIPVPLPSQVLAAAAPAIFVSADGSPMLLDADTGVMLDATTPAHSGTRIQILATGLGQVEPAWPTGVPAPLENAPRVVGNVRAYLDRVPVEVTRAELAPGYVGLYLVEINLPKIVNYGPAELHLDVDGALSNRVRVYIEP